MNISVIAGNPKPTSRALDAAVLHSKRIAGRAPNNTIDVITLSQSLLGWGDVGVKAAVATNSASDRLSVASPTHVQLHRRRKLFVDKFTGASGLAGVVVVGAITCFGSLSHDAAFSG
jgi:FMN reductase